MRPCPSIVGGARVVCYTPIDQRHVKTGNTVHLTGRDETEGPRGLAICQYDDEDGYYLFSCDQEWQSLSDTWHQALDDAKDQAEFEYKGTSQSWIPAQ